MANAFSVMMNVTATKQQHKGFAGQAQASFLLADWNQHWAGAVSTK